MISHQYKLSKLTQGVRELENVNFHEKFGKSSKFNMEKTLGPDVFTVELHLTVK